MMGDLDMPRGRPDGARGRVRAGAVVVSVDYRLAVGGVHYPVPLDDVRGRAALGPRQRRELGVDPARITRRRRQRRRQPGDRRDPPAPRRGRLAASRPGPRLPRRCTPSCRRRRPRSPRRSTRSRTLLRFPPESIARHHRQLPRRPSSRADGYAMPARRPDRSLPDRCWSTPSTTTCAPPARPSPRRSPRRASTSATCSPAACCTASSTCPPIDRTGRRRSSDADRPTVAVT